MSNISELQYFGLSDNIYKHKYLKVNVVAPLTKEREEKLTTMILEDASRWVVIESVDKDNGLQAAAVVRLKEYRDVCNGKLKKI
ncbi:hypothetical protein [Listeria riparia]|uniref:hypothetical protein n=1 Tax=Listeria riparia TaxID=1494964 RepID=UPI0004BAD7CC|nr:hypothetical protein [Listeria riparia]